MVLSLQRIDKKVALILAVIMVLAAVAYLAPMVIANTYSDGAVTSLSKYSSSCMQIVTRQPKLANKLVAYFGFSYSSARYWADKIVLAIKIGQSLWFLYLLGPASVWVKAIIGTLTLIILYYGTSYAVSW